MGDLIGISLLILISALFAMSEIAIAASRKIKLRVMADEGSDNAAAVLKLQENPGAFFAMIQIALNAIAILGGIVGEQALSPYVQSILVLFYQGVHLEKISFLFSFFTITSLFILFADLMPKRLAMIMPEAVALRVVTIMRWVTFALTPLVMFFNGLTNFVLRLFKVPAEREDIVTTEDIVAMMDAGAEYGSLQQQEYELIGNVFELEARFLSSVMTPRDQIVYFDLNESSHDIATKIIENPHNHFLVVSGNLDKLRGSVESKDILRQVLKGEPANIKQELIETDVFYLPETLSLSEALNAFKSAAKPFAVVVNEYALLVGIVTVKDLMKGFMGDLITHQGDELIIARDEHSWLVDGLTPISDLAKVLDIEEFPDQMHFETVAGFLIYTMKRIPKRAEHFTFNGFKFEVVDVEGIRVEQLLVSRISK
ncbi:hemolysin family protein [Pseudoalteromonas sp. CST5]|uniref:hemolysin family protein n=1 Tax=unclassified Pseudoalteromonas TaxID=194690 RepID=UPI002359F599|nr:MULTISPECIES: hemolysin family protein [unclassified Pseudoalteromonas]MDC9512132.1 hemolysin family protein [Pseudoalteromonas sp. CST1]MDC9536368.1 hemolysin family protein [Pseudoalteromonas sp. CST3]MDC9541098.1 hemolysin family protein [Pseudoalteromonas sp. CST2]MDC9545658.1 hemolysin family protein [Pseudoalteromonas sp. CST4]MDC9549001.1 hemolysin family protein [Pseudoalteromonas sp. CST5]